MIDPAGFALENFDAIGRWRTVDESFNPIDASGALPDGTKFNGVAELRAALVRSGRSGSSTRVTEKLLTYALGRGLESLRHAGGAADRADAAPTTTAFTSIVLGVVKSYPFHDASDRAGGGSAASRDPRARGATDSEETSA